MTPSDNPLDRAFAALKSYDSGSSRSALVPIDAAVCAGSRNPAVKRQLERRLITVLRDAVSSEAKEYVCRKLGLMGSSESVPALAALLTDKNLSEAARQALEIVPGPEATRALCDTLKQPAKVHKIGAINSLGMRQATSSVPVLSVHLKDPDPQIAAAAAAALGNIGSPKAARALQRHLPKAASSIRLVVGDACLACAERLLQAGQSTQAKSLYHALARSSPPKHIQQAIQRGMRRIAAE